MRHGRTSWSMAVNTSDDRLDRALWFRAAERIPVEADGLVPGPLDIDPLPEPSTASPERLREGWLHWWHTTLGRPPTTGERHGARARTAERRPFDPPDFDGLGSHPEFQRVVRARTDEARAWHSARKRMESDEFLRNRDGDALRECRAVEAVEAEIGRRAEPFELRILVIPVLDDRIRGVGNRTFLVPERVRATDAYDQWLHRIVSVLA